MSKVNQIRYLNFNLCYRQFLLVKETIDRVFWGPRYFLEEKNISDLEDILFLRAYLRYFLNKIKTYSEKQNKEDFSISCRGSLDHIICKFEKADQELTKIIREKKVQSC